MQSTKLSGKKMSTVVSVKMKLSAETKWTQIPKCFNHRNMHNFASYMTFLSGERWWLSPGGRSGRSVWWSQLCSAPSWGWAMAASRCHFGTHFCSPVSSASDPLPPPQGSPVFKVSPSVCLQQYLSELLSMCLTKTLSPKYLPQSLIMWFSSALE